MQNQLLACIQWLGEFQVLACIPLVGSVVAKDVADLAGVSEDQLLRIVRMTATAGFLREPQPGYLAHTSLSKPFVSKLVCLDAALCLAQIAAPAASMMSAATRRQDRETALNLAMGDATGTTFQSLRENRPKLQRQWLAHLQFEADPDGCIVQLLSHLDWHNLQNAHVVDVAAGSMALARAFAERYPLVHFILQSGSGQRSEQAQWRAARNVEDLDSRITLQTREPGAPQTVKGAAAYILNLAHASRSPQQDLRSWLLAELQAHLQALRHNESVMVIVAPDMVPEPASVKLDVEAGARAHDLLLFQVANEHEIELSEMLSLINSVSDEMGRLVIIRHLRLYNGRIVALIAKYQKS
jgi:hypothetical protein